MRIAVWFLCAAGGYLIASVNPAILLSRAVYHRDIRECGSGNPGFTNFKRTFGNKWAWWVLALDLGKAALAVALFAPLFARYVGDYALGAAYTGLFCMIGHAFPVWYGFKGGKGYLVYLSTIWFVSWRAGLLAVGVMLVLLLVTGYMSLANMLAVSAGAVYIAVCGAYTLPVVLLCAAEALFIIIRHKKNIVNLIRHTETKFRIGGKSQGR